MGMIIIVVHYLTSSQIIFFLENNRTQIAEITSFFLVCIRELLTKICLFVSCLLENDNSSKLETTCQFHGLHKQL